MAVFLDLEGAFNKVTFEAINAALRKFGLDKTLIRWIMAMLSNRVLSIDLLGVHRTGLVDRGFPQGGVLPPILWNMTVDDLLVILNEKGYQAVGYADDIAILVSGNFEEALSLLMRGALRIVEEWCSGTDKVKYLGVILDSKLEWREHIEERTNKALRIYWRCRTTFGKKWGLKPAVLHWMC